MELRGIFPKMHKTNFIFWLVSERKPRVLSMSVAGPWTRTEVEEVIGAKVMGSGRYKLELYDAPPPIGTDLPRDTWLQPSFTYYARRLPGAPPAHKDEARRTRHQHQQRYRPYHVYQPVLKGLHGRT